MKPMNRLLTILLFSLCIRLSAQSVQNGVGHNTVKPQPAASTWSGNASLGFSTSGGMSESISLNTALTLKYNTSKLTGQLHLSQFYMEDIDEKQIMNNQKELEMMLRRSLNKKFNVSLHGTAEQNKPTFLKARNTLGPGLGLHLSQGPKFQLNGDVILTYTHEAHIEGHTQNFTETHLKIDMHAQLNKNTSMDFILQPSMNNEDGDDIRIKCHPSLTAKLSSKISLMLSLNWAWDNTPPMGAEKTNYYFTTTLNANF